MVEMYGPDADGKTTLGILACASAQKEGKKIGWIDTEYSLDEDHAQHFGLNTEEIELVKPENGEEALSKLYEMCREGYDLVIVDSVAGLIPESEYR